MPGWSSAGTAGDQSAGSTRESRDFCWRPVEANAVKESGTEGVAGANGVCDGDFGSSRSDVFVPKQKNTAIRASGYADGF